MTHEPDPTAPSRLLGLDVGGTKSAALIGDSVGCVLQRQEWPSRPELGPDGMIDHLLGVAREILADHDEVTAVGVAIGGPLDVDRGVILSPPNLPGWDEVPLKTILERELGLPTRVEHDAVACALAELAWGGHRPLRRLIYFTCGTGFGAGLVFDGHPYYGAGGRPPEIGHIRLRPDGPIAYGRQGSVEAFCAASALGRIASWRFPERWPREPLSEKISQLAGEGDPDAIEVIEINATSVGEVCALAADLFHPERIVLGSLAQFLGEPWLERVRETFLREALPSAGTLCAITASTLGRRVQDLSALAAALRATP
jgi:glucokinase